MEPYVGHVAGGPGRRALSAAVGDAQQVSDPELLRDGEGGVRLGEQREVRRRALGVALLFLHLVGALDVLARLGGVVDVGHAGPSGMSTPPRLTATTTGDSP